MRYWRNFDILKWDEKWIADEILFTLRPWIICNGKWTAYPDPEDQIRYNHSVKQAVNHSFIYFPRKQNCLHANLIKLFSLPLICYFDIDTMSVQATNLLVPFTVSIYVHKIHFREFVCSLQWSALVLSVDFIKRFFRKVSS